MKSMCHEARRNSPSVADCSPTSSCLRTTSRIASSSMPRSSSASMRPALRSSRACSSSGGRSRLPTWSARNGGVVRGDMAQLPAVRVRASAQGIASRCRRLSLPTRVRRRPGPGAAAGVRHARLAAAERDAPVPSDQTRTYVRASCLDPSTGSRVSLPRGSMTPRSHAGSRSRAPRCATGAVRAMCQDRPRTWNCPRCWRPMRRLAFSAADYAELLGLYLGDGHISVPGANRAAPALAGRQVPEGQRRDRGTPPAVLPRQSRRTRDLRRRVDRGARMCTAAICRACSRRRDRARSTSARSCSSHGRPSGSPPPHGRSCAAASVRTAARS